MFKAITRYRSTFRFLKRSWSVWFSLLVPIVLSFLLVDKDDKVKQCAFVMGLMVLYWMFEPISLYMTALIPVALFPLLGIASTDEVSRNYMKGTNMMFVGGLIMGLALEHSHLHQRIALKVVVLFGSSVKTLMAGIMLVTMFLSMWINNTATTAMMIPIVDSILIEITKINRHRNSLTAVVSVDDPKEESAIDSPSEDVFCSPQLKNVRKALLLSISFSANIGGTATLTGTGTNLVLQEVFEKRFPESSDLSFTTWFFYAFPSALLTLIGAWILLYVAFVRKYKDSTESGNVIRNSALSSYQQLGPPSFHEWAVLVHFIVIIILWFTRQPEVYPGWASLLTSDKKMIKDATPAILISLSMCMIPASMSQFREQNPSKKVKHLLDWNIIQSRMAWGVVILLGGGFALADGTEKSGLTIWFSDMLGRLNLTPEPTLLIIVLISSLITEMASNVATANVVLPVLAELAVNMEVNPLKFMIPVTIAISFAFMFPVSTVKPGIFMNIIAITIQIICIETWGRLVFDFSDFPEWAQQNATAL